MILTDNKSIAKLIGLDIVAEIADDHVYSNAEDQAKYPVTEILKEAWYEAVEDVLTSYQINQFIDRIDFQSIADKAIEDAEERRDEEEEAREYEENPDNWIYDKETGVWDERY